MHTTLISTHLPQSLPVGVARDKPSASASASQPINFSVHEGITENVSTWRTDVAARIINQLGLQKVMFEGADPAVFEWSIKNYGNEINLLVDHSQIVQLEGLRAGIWGTKSTWGRIQNIAG